MLATTTDTEALTIIALPESDLNAITFGIVRLSSNGTVLYVNYAQSLFMRQSALKMVGLNFFTDVAPCANVAAFRKRFDDICILPVTALQTFSFIFRFTWGNRRAVITMIRQPGPPNDGVCLMIDLAPIERRSRSRD